jgi:hypothetical protein
MKSIKTGVVRLIVALAVLAAAAGQAAAERVLQAGKIRVFYQTVGQPAVAAVDRNQNGVPDQVEDVLTQTVAAQLLFVEVLGFPDPFRTERFRSASFLDIHLRHKDVLKSNGVTYDELQRFNKPGDPKGTISICFNVATSVNAVSNLTPAHEYFHLIQNGTTYFKNRWFTEGTARWSERGLGIGALGPVRALGPWPMPEDKAAAVFAMAYEASEYFWNPLAAKLDAKGALPDSSALKRLQAMTYTDGTPVLKDLRFTGWEFIREVLCELGKADDVAFRELGYGGWSEENQKSPKNNAFILRAVAEVVKRRELR